MFPVFFSPSAAVNPAYAKQLKYEKGAYEQTEQKLVKAQNDAIPSLAKERGKLKGELQGIRPKTTPGFVEEYNDKRGARIK
jgi:hypothetical protein